MEAINNIINADEISFQTHATEAVDSMVQNTQEATKEGTTTTAKLKTFGCKKDVFNGKARKTRGGLVATDLIINKRGKVVSRRKSEIARERGFLAGNNKNGVNYYIQPSTNAVPAPAQ